MAAKRRQAIYGGTFIWIINNYTSGLLTKNLCVYKFGSTNLHLTKSKNDPKLKFAYTYMSIHWCLRDDPAVLHAEAKALTMNVENVTSVTNVKKSKACMTRPLTEPVPPKAMPIVSPFKSRAPVPKIPKGSAGCGITRDSVTGAIWSFQSLVFKFLQFQMLSEPTFCNI